MEPRLRGMDLIKLTDFTSFFRDIDPESPPVLRIGPAGDHVFFLHHIEDPRDVWRIPQQAICQLSLVQPVFLPQLKQDEILLLGHVQPDRLHIPLKFEAQQPGGPVDQVVDKIIQ